MDVSDYRKEYAAELEKAAEGQTTYRDLVDESAPSRRAGRRRTAAEIATPTDADVTVAVAVLGDQDEHVSLRIASLRPIGISIDDDPDLIDQLLALLRDASEPVTLRKAVLSLLQEISFRMAAFPGKRPDYLEALRSIVDDLDTELRRRAIGILAREKDEYVQRRLLAGLDGTERALVPAAKAIQFLGYDVHAEYFPLLRQIVASPPSLAAKKEAVRLLVADPSSQDILAGLLGDKSERSDVRQVSAVALQSLAPNQFEAQARGIVLDDDEDDQVRATSISALTTFANPAALTDDVQLTQRVEELRGASSSRLVQQASKQFLSKQGG